MNQGELPMEPEASVFLEGKLIFLVKKNPASSRVYFFTRCRTQAR